MRPEQPNRALHAILTIFTAGLWLPVWLVLESRHKKYLRVVAAVKATP